MTTHLIPDRKDFQDKLADLLESVFDELKHSSKVLAEASIFPTQSMKIIIKPIGDLTYDEIPSIEVKYEFIPSKEIIDKFYISEKED